MNSVFIIEPPFIRVILGGLSRLLTTLATHVMELKLSENFIFRQLSSSDPVVELILISTPGAGSSEGWRAVKIF